jgi:hypothetical protein
MLVSPAQPSAAAFGKLTPALQTLAMSAQTGQKMEVMVLLNDVSEATLRDLNQLGFEITFGPNSANLVIGRITAGKLTALAELASVRTIAASH